MFRIVFMGSPPFAAKLLTTLLAHHRIPELVVTQSPKGQGRGRQELPTAVQIIAQKNQLPCLSVTDVNAPENIATLQRVKADLFLVAAFGQILKQPVLELPQLFSLNVHASLLPKYRGAAPVHRALWDGASTTGVTLQRMVSKLDAGDILSSRSTPIGKDETSVELMDRLSDMAGELVIEALEQMAKGSYSFTPQIEADATYARKIEKFEARIDWSCPADFIERQIRALQPWPIAETLLGDRRLKIYRAVVQPHPHPTPPGQIITDQRSRLSIVCGNKTALSLTEIQLENKKRLGIKNFLAAFKGHFPYTMVGAAQ